MPIALALQAGSEGRMAMGIADISGLTLGTALTLNVIPAIYIWLALHSAAQTTSAKPTPPLTHSSPLPA